MNLQSSCFTFPGAGITDVYHHANSRFYTSNKLPSHVNIVAKKKKTTARVARYHTMLLNVVVFLFVFCFIFSDTRV
jgi:hypothetical protein